MLTLRDLERILTEILAAIQPSPNDRRDRDRLIQKLQGVVDSSSIRGVSVEPFGSFVSQLFTRWGDLDISINSLNQLPGISNVEILQYLDSILPEKDGWHNKEVVALARVPILKFDQGSISCDVSIDNLPGQVKSKLLRLISEMDERFHDMVLLVKEWAKANDINDPKSGTLNSYCLSLLVIFHFQTCEPVILPPLRIICPGSAVDDLNNEGSKTEGIRRMIETCSGNINRWRTNRFREINRSSLSELFISFMDKFRDLNVKAGSYRIYTSTGTWKEKSLPVGNRNYNRNSILIVEDPFEEKDNVARTVRYRSNLVKISDAFESTHCTLTARRELSQDRVLTTIATPRVIREIMSKR